MKEGYNTLYISLLMRKLGFSHRDNSNELNCNDKRILRYNSKKLLHPFIAITVKHGYCYDKR